MNKQTYFQYNYTFYYIENRCGMKWMHMLVIIGNRIAFNNHNKTYIVSRQ